MEMFCITKLTIKNEIESTTVDVIGSFTNKKISQIKLKEEAAKIIKKLKEEYDLTDENFTKFYDLEETDSSIYIYSDDDAVLIEIHNCELE